MKYVVYNTFDTPIEILGICDTEADAQELILTEVEELAYSVFLDDYYYDYAETMTKPGDDPMKRFLEDKTPEWEAYTKIWHPDCSFYAWQLLAWADDYNYSIGEEY